MAHEGAQFLKAHQKAGEQFRPEITHKGGAEDHRAHLETELMTVILITSRVFVMLYGCACQLVLVGAAPYPFRVASGKVGKG